MHSLLLGQQTGVLSGKIVDAGTKEPLIGATVQLVGTYTGASCDLDGKFKVTNIKPGDYSVKISFLGYTDKLYNGIRIEPGKIKTLNGELTTRTHSIKEIVVVGEKNLVNLESGASEVKISSEEIAQMNVKNVQDVCHQTNHPCLTHL